MYVCVYACSYIYACVSTASGRHGAVKTGIYAGQTWLCEDRNLCRADMGLSR